MSDVADIVCYNLLRIHNITADHEQYAKNPDCTQINYVLNGIKKSYVYQNWLIDGSSLNNLLNSTKKIIHEITQAA